ncbi:ankyrin repeat protein [Trichoderma barbatum]
MGAKAESFNEIAGTLLTRVVRNLNTSNLDVNEPNRSKSPLMLAARLGNLECVRILLEKGANIDWRDQHDESALFEAAANRKFEVADFLLDQGADKALKRCPNPNLKDGDRLASIHHAVMSSQADAIKILAKFGANMNTTTPIKDGKATPLMLATRHTGLDKTLGYTLCSDSLSYGADVNKADVYGNTALHKRILDSSPDLHAIKRLFNAGADVNDNNSSGHTPLLYASRGNHESIFDYLLFKGADPNIFHPWFGSSLHYLGVSGLYGSPLQAACFSEADDHNVLAVMRYIVEDAKADVNQVCGLYGTAVHAACQRKSSSSLKLLTDKYCANLQLSDGAGRLPIHLAAVSHFDSFQHLVKLGCDIHAVDKTGRNALHWAVQINNVETVSLILSQPDVAIDAADKDGWAALCWAARGRSFIPSSNPGAQADIIELLLKKGARKSVKVQGLGDKTWTPLKIAIFHDAGDRVIQLLMKQSTLLGRIEDSKQYRSSSSQKKRRSTYWIMWLLQIAQKKIMNT